MDGVRRHDMRSGTTEAGELVAPTYDQAEEHVTQASPPVQDDDAIHPDDAEDSMLSSTEIAPRRDRHSKHVESLNLHIVAAHAAAEERANSWPAAPRSQPYNILQKRIESFQRRSNRLDATREEAFAIRMELKFFRSNYRHQHKHVDESQRTLNDHVELMVRNDDFVSTRENLLFLYGRARGDYLGLEDQSGKLQALEDRLTDLEATMRNMENQLTNNSEKILGILRHLNPAARDKGEKQEVPHTIGASTDQFSSDEEKDHVSSISSHVHPLLEEYWDKAGDVKVAKSRYIEVLKDHEDRRVQRNHQEDQGTVLELSEADFDLICEAERNAAHKAIRDAIGVRDQAKAECFEHGINPDQYRNVGDELDDVVDESTLVAEAGEFDHMKPTSIHYPSGLYHAPGPPVILTMTSPNGEAVVVNEIQAEQPSINEDVERWIESVPPQQADQLLQSNTDGVPPTSAGPIDVERLRWELEQYLARYDSADLFARLASYGIDLPSSTKQDMGRMASHAKSALSGTSRSSSESRIPALLKMNIPHAEIIAGISEAARGRRR